MFLSSYSGAEDEKILSEAKRENDDGTQIQMIAHSRMGMLCEAKAENSIEQATIS